MAKPEVGPQWESQRKSLGERMREWDGERRVGGGGDHRLFKLTVCMSVSLCNYRLAWCVESRVYHNTAQTMTKYATDACARVDARTHTLARRRLLYKAFKQLLRIPISSKPHIHSCTLSKPPSDTGWLEVLHKLICDYANRYANGRPREPGRRTSPLYRHYSDLSPLPVRLPTGVSVSFIRV